jgi:hypothetical protein
MTWIKVGTFGTGENWYNDSINGVMKNLADGLCLSRINGVYMVEISSPNERKTVRLVVQ